MRARWFSITTLMVATLAVLSWSAAPASAQGWGWRGGWFGAPWYSGGYGYSGWGWAPYGSYGWPNYYGGYAYYGTPSWGGYTSFYNPSYAAYGSNASDYGAGSEGYTSFYSGPNANQNFNGVRLNVHVPPDARVYFSGQPTSQGGEFRQFVSPPLDPSKDYTYEIRAIWTENGRPVDRTRKLDVRNGQVVNIDFLTPDRSDQPMPKSDRTDTKKPSY
jgi:uncharacterized protein (TIGR03000 family)